MSLIKIFFSSPSVLAGARSYADENYEDFDSDVPYQSVYISTVPCYLDSYIKKQNPDLYKEITWDKISVNTWSQQQVVDFVNQHGSNVLCFSVYNWNRHIIGQITNDLKRQINHDVVVIVGGPSIESHGIYDWRKDFPDADYAVFSDGEQAFNSILEHHFCQRSLNILNTKNLLWLHNGKIEKAPSAYTKITSWSPYLESSHLLWQVVRDPEYAGYEFELSYETSRGCPYSCSFCDWTSGLGPTTVKRKVDYRAELQLIADLGIAQMHISDANFGQWPVDLEIAQMMAEVLPPAGVKTQSPNLSKNKKDRAYKILEIWLESGVCDGGKFAVQDIDAAVLGNIDRPDIPWEEHKKYIQDLQAKFPNAPFAIEGIKGLPGQTRQTWHHFLRESYLLKLKPQLYTWTLIPNSPAVYDPEYQIKHKIKTRQIKTSNKHSVVCSTYSYTEMDLAYFTFTQIAYRMLEWFEVTIEEFDHFMTDIPPEWERTYFPKVLFPVYLKGSMTPKEVNSMLRTIFDNHELSVKYSDRYAQYLKNSRVAHEGYYTASIG